MGGLVKRGSCLPNSGLQVWKKEPDFIPPPPPSSVYIKKVVEKP